MRRVSPKRALKRRAEGWLCPKSPTRRLVPYHFCPFCEVLSGVGGHFGVLQAFDDLNSDAEMEEGQKVAVEFQSSEGGCIRCVFPP
jgi:hypothetical protein